jgi:hypothetical protein
MHDQDINLFPRFPLGVICGVIFVAMLFALMIIFIHENVTVIDTRVETIDGKIYDCAEANSYNNGMTYIRKPYKKIIIPTKSIKIITEIK